MDIKRTELLAAMKKALPGVENGNSILEGADTFVFNDDGIHSYNDNVSVSVPFKTKSEKGESLVGAVKAVDFFNLISKFSEDELRFVSKDTLWIIKAGNARAELTLLAPAIMDRVKNLLVDEMKWNDLPANLLAGMEVCRFSGNKSVLSGVVAEGDALVSTDEMRINWYTLAKPITESFWIRDESVAELSKIGELEKYCVSNSWVHFLGKDKTVFSCKKLQRKDYPFDKLAALVKKSAQDNDDITNSFPKALEDVLNRASVFSTDLGGFNAIRLTFTMDGIEVFAERSSGRYTETVTWDKPFAKDITALGVYIDPSMIVHELTKNVSFYLKNIAVGEKTITRVVFVRPNHIQLLSTFEKSGDK